jgi:ADP-heptose:LPS heptosyltransferase
MAHFKGHHLNNRIKFDCRHFLGDRPCLFHKAEGVTCSDCGSYSPAGKRILIIKLGAMGDVLRTTSILPALRKQFNTPHVTWITRKESVDLLENNPCLDSILETHVDSLARLQIEAFDLVINPETSKESAALASMVRGKRKKGFGLSPRGFVFTFNPEADELFHMGLLDDLKKRNRKTYEQLICRLSGLPYERVPPMLCLTEDEIRRGEEFLAKKRLKKRPRVGINTGGGTRWPLKRWTTEGFINLGKRLSRQLGVQVLLFGGPSEAEINRKISAKAGRGVIDTGCFNPPRQFATLLNLCDVVVTGDSLALHIGLALHKRMVVLLGPTSETEIDLYGLGKKITAEMDCLCCYRQVCDQSPNCMESIPMETVYRSVEEQIGLDPSLTQ